MSTLKVDSITNNGSAVDLTNGAFQIGGNSIVQGYTESTTEPANPVKGDLWWDTANEVLYQYLNGQFREIGTAPSGWTVDLANVTYDGVSFATTSQATQPRGVAFNTAGTKMYVVGRDTKAIYQYTLSTAFDLSTASYDNVSFSVIAQDDSPTEIRFNTDGTKLFMVGFANGRAYQYSLSTAFDLSTASYDNVSFQLQTGGTALCNGFCFSSDGTKMYAVYMTADDIHEYDLSTAFDLSTVSDNNVSLFVGSQDLDPVSVSFNSDGTKMYMLGLANDNIYQYTLSTGFDLSTASYDGISFSVAAQGTGVPLCITFSTNGTKLYLVEVGSDTVFQYSTGL